MTKPVIDPLTVFFLGGIRLAALVEFFELSGLKPDIFAACLDRAAEEAKGRVPDDGEAQSLRQAVAIAEEEAKQLRLARRKG